jgi:hypothetical protein
MSGAPFEGLRFWDDRHRLYLHIGKREGGFCAKHRFYRHAHTLFLIILSIYPRIPAFVVATSRLGTYLVGVFRKGQV